MSRRALARVRKYLAPEQEPRRGTSAPSYARTAAVTLSGMLNIINWPRVRAEKFHNFLPEDIRSFLKGRGIPATIIERHLLGWNGERITIPVFSPKRQVIGFRYAKSPTDISDSPEVISDPDLGPQLYG